MAPRPERPWRIRLTFPEDEHAREDQRVLGDEEKRSDRQNYLQRAGDYKRQNNDRAKEKRDCRSSASIEFDLERCGNATMSLAQASGALEDVILYVQERQQFGKPIIDFQAVQIRLAEMQIRVEAARLLIWRAASNAQDGLPSVIDSSVAKCFANEMAREVCGHAVQLMGAYGYSREYPMERRLRDAWGWGIAGGAIDIQKVNIAAAMVSRRFDQRR